MPRYKYQCTECDTVVTVYHGINETLLDCEDCLDKQTMIKVLSVPIIIKDKKTNNDNNKVGKLTEQYIEENRKILEQQKEEARDE
jgi:putative FmdB family regulatory protein